MKRKTQPTRKPTRFDELFLVAPPSGGKAVTICEGSSRDAIFFQRKITFPQTSKDLLRRYLDPQNLPKTPSLRRIFRCLGVISRSIPKSQPNHLINGWSMVNFTPIFSPCSNEFGSSSNWMFPKIGVPPNHPILIGRVFHYKPSILGAHPYFWKHPTVFQHVF